MSATPNAAGRLHVAGVSDTVAQHTATTVTHALKHLGICNGGADVRLEPAGAGDPPLATGRYSGTLELPIALALLAATGKLPADRIAGIVAVGGLDPFAANERAGVRCIGGGGTTAIAHAAETRELRLIVAEDQTAAACAECRETTGATTLDELVAVLAGDRDGDPLPPRTAAVKRRDPAAWRIGEGDLRALEIACAGWHNIHVIGPHGDSLPQYGRIAQALLPDLAGEAARETTRIHGVAGLMAPWTARVTEPPLRVPHYTASRGAVAGSRGRPGEVNLAHNGVLVIDQPTEFDRGAADALVAIAEDGQTVTYRLHPGRTHDPDAGPLPPHGGDPARRARQPTAPRREPARPLRHRDHRRHADRPRDAPRTAPGRPGAHRPGGGDPRGRPRRASSAAGRRTTRRAGASGPWPTPSRRSTDAGSSRATTSPKPNASSTAAIADDRRRDRAADLLDPGGGS